jgi:hypothetical protein
MQTAGIAVYVVYLRFGCVIEDADGSKAHNEIVLINDPSTNESTVGRQRK